ncbi:MAG: hypothetical protein OXI96_11125 [Acidimicrobiaceae bacterium]|nr:hypothetical protein [Acidimicrobiaceae bacterium]
MNIPTIDIEALNKIPENVQKKIDQTDIRNHLEQLIRVLNNEDLQEDEHRQFLNVLTSWIIEVLSNTTEPLFLSLSHLEQRLSDVASHARHKDFNAVRQFVPDLLKELASLPTIRPEYSIESAQALNVSIRSARQQLVSTGEQLAADLEETKSSFQETLDSYSKEIEEITSSRSQEIEETVRGQSQEIEEIVRSRSQKINEEAERTLGELSVAENQVAEKHEAVLNEMEELLASLQGRYGFTATQVLGGAHELAAKSEEDEAAKHEIVSRWTMWVAVAWAGLAQLAWVLGWTPEWDRWFDVFRSFPILGSPVVILLFVARREGRIASEHRSRHERLQSLSLQFRSWEPYRDTLSEEVRSDLEREVTPRLFTGDVQSLEKSTS